MNKQVLYHSGWALVAVTSFILGSQFVADKSDSANTSNQSGPGVSVRSSPGSADDDGSSSNRKRSVRTRGASDSENSGSLSETDIKELGAEFKTAKGPIARRLIFGEMLKALTPENAKLMRENIAHLSHDSPEFREFHYAWGALAGQEAVLHGAETPKRDMASTLAGWAATDPAAAMAYFDSLSPEEQNGANHMKWGAAFGLADADPQLAAEFAIERFQNGDREAEKMIRIAAGAALQSGDQEDVTSFLANLPEGEMNLKAHQHAAHELAQNDPDNAIGWALSLSESEGKYHAVGSSFYAYASRNPTQAAEAINQIPAEQRDHARYGYSLRVVHDNPAVGVEWAAAINNPEARNNALVDTGRVYMRKDREGATQWLQNSGLSAEDQARITGKK